MKYLNQEFFARICLWLKGLEQPRWLVFAGAVAAVCLVVLTIRSCQFAITTPDKCQWYDAEHLEAFFCDQDKTLIQLYIVSQITFDSVLPLAYGMLLGMLIVKYYKIRQATQWLPLPTLAVVFDFLENASLIYLAATWKCDAETYPALASLAPFVSRGKWLMLYASIAVVLMGWLRSNRASS